MSGSMVTLFLAKWFITQLYFILLCYICTGGGSIVVPAPGHYGTFENINDASGSGNIIALQSIDHLTI